MNKYELIFEKLQAKYEAGEITYEQAEAINDMAYEKYVVEQEIEEEVTSLIQEFMSDVKYQNEAEIRAQKDRSQNRYKKVPKNKFSKYKYDHGEDTNTGVNRKSRMMSRVETENNPTAKNKKYIDKKYGWDKK